MKNLLKNIYLFVLLVLSGLSGYAQLYPVQLTPVFNSPYSVKISDYANSMDTKMQLLINPTDISISQRQVRLKLYIQGNGLNIQSSDFIQGQRPIFINGGELQTLTNTDIAALFRLENLQGITAAQYANPLPEGMYNFCFELYDFVTNQKISQKSCASLYLILNDPPLLNTPQRNEQIAASEFPNIVFTWTPRQTNATNISYKFELKQLIDPTLDPQFAFQMASLLYEETLFGTALLYNLSMPILTPGMRYAWRVRAISTTGLSENSVFKNDGYSEIYAFKYTSSCAAPTFLLSEAQGTNTVRLSWQGIPEHTRYQIQYKKQDVRNAEWFSSYSLNTQSLLTNLEPGVTYQFRVGSSCDPATDGVQSFTYSGISTFTTPTQTNGVPAYNCGIIPQINIQNQKPLTNLIESETFTAGDFPVTVLELQGHGPYSGKGYIIVPYLNETKIAVQFNNITINTDYKLINGVVETSYDSDWKNVVGLDGIISDAKDLISGIADLFKRANELEKQKVAGTITENEYNKNWKEIYEGLEKADKEYKELVSAPDVPENLKKKIADLDPVFIELASNNFTTKGNQNSKNIAKVNDAFTELDNYKKEQEALFEKISKGIDFEKLITWMRDNSGKTVLFDYTQFLTKDFELTGSGLGMPQTIKINKDFEFETNGIKKSLKFIGLLSTRKENITLSANNSPIGLNIDFGKSKITYDFNYLYDKIVEGQDKTAIKLTTTQISDYDALLGFLSYSIGETGSKAKEYVVNNFTKAFQIAGNDCNKIDFLYAEAPNFIIGARGNDKLWEDLQILSKCSIHYLGTNENNSVLNILNNIDSKWIFGKQESNIVFFADLFTKLNLDYRPQYIRVLSQIGLKNWTADEINKSQFYLMEPYQIDGLKPGNYTKIISWCGDNTSKTKYEIGYTVHNFETGNLTSSDKKIVDLGTIEKNDPVHIRLGENDYLMPAFIAYILTNEAVTDDRNIAINNALSVVLPEFERLSLKKLKWLDEAVQSSDEIIQSTNEIVKSVTKNLTKLKIPESVVDDIIIRAMYVDDAIGNNQMLRMIDDLAKNPKFKNPEDLLENLNSVFRKPVNAGNVNSSASTDLLNEYNEGMYWMNQGDEVYISKKWSGNADEVDVTITTKNALVECKNVSGENFKSVESNLKAIVDKYTVESKLSTSFKNQYPNHYGKLNISSSNNPFYNSTKADFISKIKNGDLANGQLSIIGNESNQIPLIDLKKVKELYIENANGRFIIKNTDW
ncbi:TANFOR domain-containing protein [Flavobacterium sp. 270]|uniref:fibronectin type III domain-containing protein n=1 Tax=Flavobacterium sp. 270 TaxID=2512114 RepID=UPI0010649F0B|nr:fibronectin type III domain-containing protein [Flavobacterium sp. 270]TDW52804.1 TANFOR domain-containing protein [Flavobacterium sp. 270]